MKKTVDARTVRGLLIRLGVAPKTNGYLYLTCGICCMLGVLPSHIGVTVLYARIAKQHGVSAASVERCMRFAVSRAYDAGKCALLNDLYGADVIRETPTVSDFLYYVTEYLGTFYAYDDFLLG